MSDDQLRDALAAMIRAELHAANHSLVPAPADRCTPCTKQARTAAAALLPEFQARGAEIDSLRRQLDAIRFTLDLSEPSPAWLSGWESALAEVQDWAQLQAKRAEKQGDKPSFDAYWWCSTFAAVAYKDPTAPGRLADRADLRVAAQEAGEPPTPRGPLTEVLPEVPSGGEPEDLDSRSDCDGGYACSAAAHIEGCFSRDVESQNHPDHPDNSGRPSGGESHG
jgi:hypothetical protein